MYFLYKDGRAIYKHKRYSRCYRQVYPSFDTNLKLWTTNNIQNALRLRVRTFEYSNEWFDVYENDVFHKVDISKINFKPLKIARVRLLNDVYQGEDGEFNDAPFPNQDNRIYKKGRVFSAYRWNHWYQTFENQETEDKIILVSYDGKPFLSFDSWERMEFDCGWVEVEYD